MRSLTEGDVVSELLLPYLEGGDAASAGCAELAGLLKVGLWYFFGIERSSRIFGEQSNRLGVVLL